MTRTSRCKQPRRRLHALALAVAVPIVFGTPALANQLVTRDGSVIETSGSWKVQGRLVVFELPSGQLASLQLGEVDLEASRAAVKKASPRATKPGAPRPLARPAVLVLTDADIPRAPAADRDTAKPAADGGGEDENPGQEQRLVVGSWEETLDVDGVVITGELVNKSPDVAAGIQLAVFFYDREEGLLKTTLATITSKVLKPGQRARFRADGRGVFDYESLRFEADSLGFCGQLRDGGPCGAS